MPIDALSDVFSTLQVQSTLYFRAELGAPWALDVPANPQTVRFHAAIDGRCEVEVDGSTFTLQRGDVVVVPHGARHLLRAGKRVRTRLVGEVLDETAFDGTEALRYGGDGECTTLVCGHFAFGDELSHPVLETLPEGIHLPAARGLDFAWLDAATRALGAETSSRPPGWELIVNRVSEILFVQVLRAQLHGDEMDGALRAFVDPRVGRALDAIHADPARDWDVGSLAQLAGMSRTSFAVGFRELMGLTPAAYVTRWRMQKARGALLRSDSIVARIALDVGYASEAAFSRAFQRHYGSPPATYRREAGAGV